MKAEDRKEKQSVDEFAFDVNKLVFIRYLYPDDLGSLEQLLNFKLFHNGTSLAT